MREADWERDRQTETETERQRQRERQTGTERQRQRDIDRDRDREIERQTDRQTEKELYWKNSHSTLNHEGAPCWPIKSYLIKVVHNIPIWTSAKSPDYSNHNGFSSTLYRGALQ